MKRHYIALLVGILAGAAAGIAIFLLCGCAAVAERPAEAGDWEVSDLRQIYEFHGE